MPRTKTKSSPKSKTKTKKTPPTIFWEKWEKGKKQKGMHVSFVGLSRVTTTQEVEWLHQRVMEKGFLLCQVGENDYLIVSDVKHVSNKQVNRAFPKGKV